MSYIVTSNNYDDRSIAVSERNSAFSYRNTLTDSYHIPPDSEIAVSSVKINRNNLINLTKGMFFYQFFGVPVASDSDPAQKSNTNYPHKVQLLEDKDYQEVTINEMAQKLSKAINESVFHPELFNLVDVDPYYDGSEVFKGFTYKFGRKESGIVNDPSSKARDTLSGTTRGTALYQSLMDSGDANALSGLYFDQSTFELEARVQTGTPTLWANVTDFRDVPLGTNYSELQVDLTDVAGTNWAVGLARSDDGGFMPPHFNMFETEIPQYNMHFYDFVIGAFQIVPRGDRWLMVFHAVKDSANGITMKEVRYWEKGSGAGGNAITDGSGRYNWSRNTTGGGSNVASSIDQVTFTIKNEIMVLNVNDATGEKLVTATSEAGFTKTQAFKPVVNTCNCLYPRIFIQSGGKKVTMSKIGGVGPPADYPYFSPLYDWNAYLLQNNAWITGGGADIDTRFYNDMSDPTTYTAQGLTIVGAGANITSGTLTNYENVFIVEESKFRYPNTTGANLSRQTGFKNRTIIDGFGGSGIDNVTMFSKTSTSHEDIFDNNSSLFVRLNQMNIRSLNTGKGMRSMIMYHLPRFDSSGNSVGQGLFYEPHERIYLKLNNSENLTINDWWIDIVNEDETLAKTLTGKTIVTFHIRSPHEKKDMKLKM